MNADERADVDRRIVVGIGGSDSSRHALRWAISVARTTGATVEGVVGETRPADCPAPVVRGTTPPPPRTDVSP